MPQSGRISLLLIYHSMTHGTHQMVQACAKAAQKEHGVCVLVKQAALVQAEDLLEASGFIFASPEYLGGMSGIMKDCFDRTYYPCLNKLDGRPYAIMVCAGSDGQGAVRQLERIITGWRLKPVGAPIIVNVGAQTPERILATKQLMTTQLVACEELGSLFATGLAMGLF